MLTPHEDFPTLGGLGRGLPMVDDAPGKPEQFRNIRILIEYDGTDFHGWQRQENGPSIQSTIEDQLARLMNRRVIIYGASRTDSGVHAKGQVACFYADVHVPPDKWMRMLNDCLPPSICILEATEVPHGFHAQRTATGKIYEYRVLNRPFRAAMDRHVYFFPRQIDWEKVRQVLPMFIGRKDFRSFQGAKSEVKTTIREVHRFELFAEGGGIYRFEVEGNGFLKQMVRAMVGTVLDVGEGKIEVERIPEIIAACDRRAAGRTVPASGLCLVRVLY